ncbi:hypothetical protein ACEWY4_022311 [Coilia grayii]|uniref:Uncharacterized protein n=1 Tax=Coilia grayii TaxID=363190 RepID=A0ABD1J5P3_9TELE
MQYSVEYAIYGDEDKTIGGQVTWRPVKHCTQILQSSCDLSDQTHKLDEAYYARVKAMDSDHGVASDWAITPRFEPRTDTALGPPQLTVRVDGNSLDIKLKGPMRWKNKHMKKDRSLRNVINGLYYNISVYENTTRQMRRIITENQSYKVGSLEYDSLYCISAGTYSRHIPVQSHASEWHCETTPPDPFKAHMLLVILGGLLPSAVSLFVLITAGCLVYHYIFGNKLKQPCSMTMTPRDEILEPKFITTIDANLKVVKPSLQPPLIDLKDELEKLLSLDVQQHISGSSHLAAPQQPSGSMEPKQPSYAQQGPDSAPPPYNSQSWQSSEASSEDSVHSDTEAQGSEDDMPPDYGFVVHQPPEESRGRGFDSLIQSQPPAAPAAGSDPYRGQSDVRPWQLPCQSAPDNNLPTVIDWNPSTGVLRIPQFSPIPPLGVRGEEEQVEAEEEEGGNMHRNIFSSLMVRQPSQDSCEPEDSLSQMETVWQLQVNMEE